MVSLAKGLKGMFRRLRPVRERHIYVVGLQEHWSLTMGLTTPGSVRTIRIAKRLRKIIGNTSRTFIAASSDATDGVNPSLQMGEILATHMFADWNIEDSSLLDARCPQFDEFLLNKTKRGYRNFVLVLDKPRIELMVVRCNAARDSAVGSIGADRVMHIRVLPSGQLEYVETI